ncbi:MAG: hypothetical protein AAGB02_04185 [Pseudomonadota bacterium]
MGMISRLLSMLPSNWSAPVLFLLAGWYGGAKYGAPELLLNTVDGAVQQVGDVVGGFVGGQNDNSGDTQNE